MQSVGRIVVSFGLLVVAVGCQDERGIERRKAPTTLPIDYEQPKGWRRLSEPGPFSKLTLTAAEDRLGVTVSSFPKTDEQKRDDALWKAKYLVPNIDRWHTQVGADPLTPEAEEKLEAKFPMAGLDGYYVDVVGKADDKADGKGDPERILGVFLPRKNDVWVFKLKGANSLVGKEKEAFDSFLKSVKFNGAYDG